ncbi:hypothetical protein [Oceanobacillus jeddahense]|uniref:hypothetical protein n=1 Tax=Oceanobacillus jeddahense TaxID=1462527 RepID=UPI000595CAD5|nr:hypothetical protein [Oceanobacillus jeddahense]
MDDNEKIHLLSQELIPVINDLDEEPKQIVLEHIEACDECENLYAEMMDVDKEIPEHAYDKEVEIKPLKKLVQFNKGLKLLLIAVRAIILFYVTYSSFQFYDLESPGVVLQNFQGGILLFYFPAAVFLLVFTFTFFNKKWLWISLTADAIIIFLFGNMLQFFF